MTASWRTHWSLDPEVRFLNHGSFGACPTAVLEHQSELRARLERQPVRFMVRELGPRLDGTREQLGAFLGAPPGDLAFVRNATSGVNAVLRSLPLARGDELLVTTHAYLACRNALEFVAERAGARVVIADVPFPIEGPDEIIARVMERVTDRTRLALLDHVTSPTGVVLPLATLVDMLGRRGVDTLVDGAHAPGMLDLDVAAIGAAYYTGNCHKWICAPKGAAFLYVRPDRQREVRPLTISHGASSTRTDRSRFLVEFDWTGTDDPTPMLSIGRAIDVMGGLLPGGWPELRERNHALVLEGRDRIARALGVRAPVPDDMIGSLASLPIPDGSPTPPSSPLFLDPLQDVLLERHGIEVPIVPWPAPPRRLVRVSAQLYNTREEYDTLAEVLGEVLGPIL